MRALLRHGVCSCSGSAKGDGSQRGETGDEAKNFLGDGNGYFRQQSTRPQTNRICAVAFPGGVGYVIYEKFYSWTDNNGSPEDALSRDPMLDNISL